MRAQADRGRAIVYRVEDDVERRARLAHPHAGKPIGDTSVKNQHVRAARVAGKPWQHGASVWRGQVRDRLRCFVDEVVAHPTWCDLGGPAKVPVVRLGGSGGASTGGQFAKGLGVSIGERATTYTVVHELAHVVAQHRGWYESSPLFRAEGDSYDTGHGPQWRAVTVLLTRLVLGEDWSEDLNWCLNDKGLWLAKLGRLTADDVPAGDLAGAVDRLHASAPDTVTVQSRLL